MRFPGTDAVRGLFGRDDSTRGDAQTDGGQRVVLPEDTPVDIRMPDDVDDERIEATLSDSELPDDQLPLRIEAAAASDSTVTPVATDSDDTLAATYFDTSREWPGIRDPKIRNIEENSVEYTHTVGQWILENDDLVPGVLSRLKGLILGAEGLIVEPEDPDDDADQRLAEYLQEIYAGQSAGMSESDPDLSLDPAEVVDTVLTENVKNALYVTRSTDLQHLDLSTLSYLKDGASGEEVYVQEEVTYTTVDVSDDGAFDIEEHTTDDERALRIGEDVFDVELYRSSPLKAVSNDVVNKIQLKRLKGRKAEIASIGGIYITVEPPKWLPESDYDDLIQGEDNPLGSDSITKLELALAQDLESALETLQEYQSATVMSVPAHWEVSTIDLPEMDETFDDMVRGYNQAISRRLLFPFDLLELDKGSELSRDSMMTTLINTISGWQGELATLFDDFAEVQTDIHNMGGSVEHRFPSIASEDEKQIVQLLNYAGLLELDGAEARKLVNSMEGVDLDTDAVADTDDLPPAGGPNNLQKREQAMRDRLSQQQPDEQQPDDEQPPQDVEARTWDTEDYPRDDAGQFTEKVDVPEPPAEDTERATNLWKELINRLVMAERGIQFVRDTDNAEAAAELAAEAGFEADWNPILHPRDPETGKFVERAYPVPNDIAALSSEEAVRELAETVDDFGGKIGRLSVTPEADEAIGRAIREARMSVGTGDTPTDGPADAIQKITESDMFEREKVVEIANIVESETGVTTKFEAFDAEKAAIVAETFIEMRERGEATAVEQLVSTLTDDQLQRTPDAVVGKHFPIRNAVYINPSNFTEEVAEEHASSGFVPTADRAHAVRHELGHSRHVEANRTDEFGGGEDGTTSFFGVRQEGLTSDQRKLLREQVSTYAADSPAEARAEIYALLAAGESLPDDVMELYRLLGGIIPEQP